MSHFFMSYLKCYFSSDLNAKNAKKKSKLRTSSSRRSLSGTRRRTKSRRPTPSRRCSSAGSTSTPASQRSDASSRPTDRSNRSRWYMTKRRGSRRVIALLNMSMKGICIVSIPKGNSETLALPLLLFTLIKHACLNSRSRK